MAYNRLRECVTTIEKLRDLLTTRNYLERRIESLEGAVNINIARLQQVNSSIEALKQEIIQEQEQQDIKKTVKALESRNGKLTNIELAELSRLKSREQALTRHLLSLGYKENEIQAKQIEHAEIIEKLKAQGIEITADELNNYI